MCSRQACRVCTGLSARCVTECIDEHQHPRPEQVSGLQSSRCYTSTGVRVEKKREAIVRKRGRIPSQHHVRLGAQRAHERLDPETIETIEVGQGAERRDPVRAMHHGSFRNHQRGARAGHDGPCPAESWALTMDTSRFERPTRRGGIRPTRRIAGAMSALMKADGVLRGSKRNALHALSDPATTIISTGGRHAITVAN